MNKSDGKKVTASKPPAGKAAGRSLYPASSRHGRLAHSIGREIVSGVIAEGEVLPRELELAEQYEIGRQAVREGLKVLSAKGLIKTRRRAGSSVAPRTEWNLLDPDILAWHPPEMLPPKFLSDLVEIRRLIEPGAVALAASRGEPEDVKRIGAALRKMERNAADVTQFYAADVEFHNAVFTASGNDLIQRLSAILAPLFDASFRIQGQAIGSVGTTIHQHSAVYQAIAEGDADKARRAMETILETARGALAQDGDEEAGPAADES